MTGLSLLRNPRCVKELETKDGTATAGEIIKGKTAYVNGSKITGALSLISVTQDANTKALTIK